jgi:NADH:ubiquinone oxidoreductase subunit F (NADH-binding)
LPALAEAVEALTDGGGDAERLRQLCGLVEGRGACAHPDGTARLVRSLLTELPEEVEAHLDGWCPTRMKVA